MGPEFGRIPHPEPRINRCRSAPAEVSDRCSHVGDAAPFVGRPGVDPAHDPRVQRDL